MLKKFRYFVLAVLFSSCFAIAEEVADLSSTDTPRIYWNSGNSIMACDVIKNTVLPNCQSIPLPAKLPPIQNVIQGDFVNSPLASWILETADDYQLCILTQKNQLYCEPLSIPHLEGSQLSFQKDTSSSKDAIVLSMQEGMPDFSLKDLESIAQRFAESYIDARRQLHAYLHALGENELNLVTDRQPHALRVIIRQLAQSSSTQPIEAAVDISANNGKSDIYPFTCPDPGCIAACTAAYNSACAYCTGLPHPAARAACYAGAMAVYAACMRGC